MEVTFWQESRSNLSGAVKCLNPYSNGSYFLTVQFYIRHTWVSGLNPYSNGSYFLTIKHYEMSSYCTRSLNPYSNGSYFLTWIQALAIVTTIKVLILILMEVTFWHLTYHPYLNTTAVLILILMEVTFWLEKTNRKTIKLPVLILILMEVTFWQNAKKIMATIERQS